MKFEACLDRFEADKAILLIDERQMVWPKNLLPPESREGDILSVEIVKDDIATDKAKREVKELLQELTQSSKEG